MANYVFIYFGGGEVEMDEAARDKVMAAWGEWFKKAGSAVVDGGNPFGHSKTVTSGGTNDKNSGATGYTIVKADSMDEAVKLTEGHPHLDVDGGRIEVYETFQVM